MGGGDNRQTTQTTQSASPEVTALTNKLASGLSGLVSTGSKVYSNPLYTGLGTTTQSGVGALTAAASNPNYSNAVNNTIDEFGAIASGQRMGKNDAAWNNAKQSVIADTNAAFNANGRFGGGSNVAKVAQGLGGVELARIQGNEARQASAAASLPGLFAAGLAPAQATLSAGSVLDADALARRQADAQLFDAQNNSAWNDYARASSILNGTAQAAGTTTTQTQPATPWWQSALGLGFGALGAFG